MSNEKVPVVIIVAALLPGLGIGFKGKLPWRLKNEIKYFKDVTSRTKDQGKINAVIMGRKTWDSIPEKFRPLSNRINVVLSRNHKNETIDGIIHANSFEESLKQLQFQPRRLEKIFIIGGSEVYNDLIKKDKITHILLTEIRNSSHLEIDTWLNFPLYSQPYGWKQQSGSRLQKFTGYEKDPEVEITEGDYTFKYTLWERS